MFFLDDDKVYEAKCPARLGGLPELAFSYKIAAPLRVFKHNRTIQDAAAPETILDEYAKLVAEHVVSWDVATKGPVVDGQPIAVPVPVPVTPAAVAKLPHPVLVSMVNHVQGYAPAA